MPHRLPYRFAVCAAAVFLLAGCLFAAAYHYDNKYLFGPPYGADGVIEVSDDDLDRPVPLVDGWMLSVDGGPRTETFIPVLRLLLRSGRNVGFRLRRVRADA